MARNQDDERPRFSYLHHDVRRQLDISWAEYVLLDMVYHLSAKYGFCWMSTAAIARTLGMGFNSIKEMVARLVDRELLVRDTRGLMCGQAYLDIAYLEKYVPASQIAETAIQPSEIAETAIKQPQKLRKPQRIAETVDNIKIYINKEHQQDDEPLTVELAEFVKMRKTIKKPITDYGLNRIRLAVQKLYPNDIELQRECLNKSIEQGWQGVFPLKDLPDKPKPIPHANPHLAEITRQLRKRS